MEGTHRRTARYAAGLVAAAALLIGVRVAADCNEDEYEHIRLTLQSVTVDGQPQGGLSAYDGWSAEIASRPVSSSQPQRIEFTATQGDTSGPRVQPIPGVDKLAGWPPAPPVPASR